MLQGCASIKLPSIIVPLIWHCRFSPAPQLGKRQRFCEGLARGAVTEGLVQSLVIVQASVAKPM